MHVVTPRHFHFGKVFFLPFKTFVLARHTLLVCPVVVTRTPNEFIDILNVRSVLLGKVFFWKFSSKVSN